MVTRIDQEENWRDISEYYVDNQLILVIENCILYHTKKDIICIDKEYYSIEMIITYPIKLLNKYHLVKINI